MPLSKYHWVRDRPDSRDHLYFSRAPIIPLLKDQVDLRPYCSDIEDQEYLGSCTGQAIAGIMEYIARRVNKLTEVSRLFIYYQERVIEGTVDYDSGAYIRSGIKAVNKFGAPIETLWPYIPSEFATKPSQDAYDEAITRRAVSYERCVNFNTVKNALSNDNPVVVGFDVYESFESKPVITGGIMPYPDVNNEELLGGHAVTLVGYNESEERFIARNSWGTEWGDKGYFYMPYAVIQNTSMSDDFWIITNITNP